MSNLAMPLSATALPQQSPTVERAADAGTRCGARTRLVGAAVQTFAARGYAQTTVADVVTAARTSKRSFYALFSSKCDLLLGVVEAMHQAFREDVAARTHGVSDPEEMMGQVALSYFGVSCLFPTISEQALGGERVAGDRYLEYLDGVVEQFETAVQSQFGGVMLPVNRMLFPLFLRGLDALAASTYAGPTHTDEQVSEEMVRGLARQLFLR